MLKSEDREIAGYTYRVTQLPFTQGRDLLHRLFRVAGPALGSMMKGLDNVDASKATLADIKMGALGDAFSELAQTLTASDLEYICDAMAEQTLVKEGRDGGGWLPLKQIIELHFQGRFGAMFKWLGFALQVNYRDFLADSGSLAHFAGRMRAQTPPLSDSQPTSIGKSSDSSVASTLP